MYKPDLSLNNLQWLICHKTKPNKTKAINHSLLIISCKTTFYTILHCNVCKNILATFLYIDIELVNKQPIRKCLTLN